MPCTGSVAGAAGCRRHRGAPQRCCRIRGSGTPSGQRCCRTRAKHLKSSINDARLTRSGAAMAASAPSRVASSILLLLPQRLPGSPYQTFLSLSTPDPEKSHQELFQTRADAASLCRQIETSRPRKSPPAHLGPVLDCDLASASYGVPLWACASSAPSSACCSVALEAGVSP